ncbi:MAG: glycosyltransferase [Candidatus Omnitrophica bacterium]|nr:glycosyltransferase [Candidatus Omnitrophota bacterium]
MKPEETIPMLPLYRFLSFIVFCLFIFFLPFSKATAEVSIALFFAFWLLSSVHAFFLDPPGLRRSLLNYFKLPPFWMHGGILFFLMALMASAIAGFASGSGISFGLVMHGLLKYSKWLVVFYASAELFRHPKWLNPAMKVMAAGLGLMIFDALLQAVFDFDLFHGYSNSKSFPIPRLRACFGTENAFASYLVLVMPPVFCAVFYWIKNLTLKKNRSLAWTGMVLCLVFSLFVFVQTRTRSAWLGIFIGLLLSSTVIRKRYLGWVLIFLAVIYGTPTALNGINENLAKRNPQLYNVYRDEEIFQYTKVDIQERMTLWKQAWMISKEHLWIGAGPNTYNEMVSRYPIPGHKVTPYAHNSYLQTLAELGIVGTLPLMWILIGMIFVCWKTLRISTEKDFSSAVLLGLFVGLTGFLIKAAFDTEFHSFNRINLFWCLAGMAMGIVLSRRESRDSWMPASADGKFKIVHAANYQSVQHLILPHMIHQKAQGHEVVGLTSCQAPYDQLAGILVEKIKFEAQAFQPFKEFAGFLRLMKAFYREAPDVVHTHNVKFGIFGRLAARAMGVPYVVHTAHGIYRTFEKQDFKNRLIDLLEKLCNLCCDAVFFVSPFDHEAYLKSGVVRSEQAFLIGNGIDLDRFDPFLMTGDSKQAKRKELGIGPRTKIVGMVSRLVRDKGFAEFFEAAQKLARQEEDVLFMVVSSRYQRCDSVFESIAEQYGVKDKTIFLYDREDMPALYSVMDILAHPSWREGLPRVVMEAASMGVFCVVTDIPGNRNVIRDETYGKLVPVRNPEELFRALSWALQHPQECQDMAGKAQNYARKNFEGHAMIHRLDEGYRQAIPGYSLLPNPAGPQLVVAGS